MTADTIGKKTPRKPRKKLPGSSAAQSAGKKPAEEIRSKADLIRTVARIIRAKGKRPRPTEVVQILGEEGVEVSAAQVSMTLKAAGYRPLRKRRKGGKAADDGVDHKETDGVRWSKRISMDDLLAAKSVSGAFGGTDRAIAALRALKRLEG